MELSEVFERLDLPKKQMYSGYIMAVCCFHDDNSPSLLIKDDYYRCLACGASGRTESLVGDEYTYYESKEERTVSPWASWIREHETVPKVLAAGYKYLKENPDFDYYLSLKRKLSSEVIKKCRLGWLNGWITIPVFDGNRKVLGGTVRNTTKSDLRYINPSRKFQPENLVYAPNWERVNKSDYVVLVFGIIDALTLEQYKIPAITTTEGAKNQDLFDSIRKPIHVIPDKGENHLVRSLVNSLGWRGKMVDVPFPDEMKDINDLHRNDKMEVVLDVLG